MRTTRKRRPRRKKTTAQTGQPPDMSSSDLAKFYADACKRIETLESEKRSLLNRQKEQATTKPQSDESQVAVASIRAQCASERNERLKKFQMEYRLIEEQLNRRLTFASKDSKVIEAEILHWKKRFLARTHIWQTAITQDHWYFTRSLIHQFIGKICGRHPLCGVENHLKPLVDPAENDPSKWEAAFQILTGREPLPNLVFLATQTVKPPLSTCSSPSQVCPVGTYAGNFADRVSQLLGKGEQIQTEAGVMTGGIPTFLHLFGATAEGEFVRFLVVCNMANEFILVDFSQSQASRGALLRLFRSPAIEKLLWKKDAVLTALKFTLWADFDSFNEVYDLATPWAVGTGPKADDVHYVNEAKEYLKTRQPSEFSLRNSELAKVASVFFHTKEVGEIFGSSIIDLMLFDKSDWVLNDATVGWKRIDPKIFVSVVVTAGTISDVAVATAILNPNWRMGFGTCPSILSRAVDRFLTSSSVPAHCVKKVIEEAEPSFPKCRYMAECIHHFVMSDTGAITQETIADERALSSLQRELDDAYKLKAELDTVGSWPKRDLGAAPFETTVASRRSEPLLTPPTGGHQLAPAPYGVTKQSPIASPEYNASIGYSPRCPPLVPPMVQSSLLPQPAPVPPLMSQRLDFRPPYGNAPVAMTRLSVPRQPPPSTQKPPLSAMKPLLTKKEIILDIAKLKKEDILPFWVRSYMIPRLPLVAENDAAWTKVPVPRLTMPTYYKTLADNHPLMALLIQWRREYKQAVERWSRGDPWERIPILLGALATEAQLLACRIVFQLWKERPNRRQAGGTSRHSVESLLGLLTEFCVFVEEVTRIRTTGDSRKPGESDHDKKLRKLMQAALEEEKRRTASTKDGSEANRESGNLPMMAAPNHPSEPKTTAVAPASSKFRPKPVPAAVLPKTTRLFCGMTDTYPLAIVPSVIFQKLKSGFYRASCSDPSLACYIGTDPHPLCDMLPAAVIPPKVFVEFARSRPQRLRLQEYNPFGHGHFQKDDKSQVDDDAPISKKPRVDGGDGILN